MFFPHHYCLESSKGFFYFFFFKYESYLFPKSKQSKQSGVVIASAGLGYRRKPFQKASPERDDLKL